MSVVWKYKLCQKKKCNSIITFEMWPYRLILLTCWVDRAGNGEVLRRMNTDTEFLYDSYITQKTRLEYSVQVMSNTKYDLLQITILEKIPGKRRPRRKGGLWLAILWMIQKYEQFIEHQPSLLEDGTREDLVSNEWAKP